MPLLARLLIKTALGYLAGALGLGIGVAAGWPWAAGLGPAWVHLLVVGWLTQLIFGVAYWLFPRHSRERPYGYSAPAWAAFGLLNAGLLLRLVAEPMVARGGVWPSLLVVSAAAQALGVLAFVGYLWPRVRTR